MSKKLEHINLPDWPRLMQLKLAAAYLDISIPSFKKYVAVDPVKILGPDLYDKQQLDNFVQGLSESESGDLVSILMGRVQ